MSTPDKNELFDYSIASAVTSGLGIFATILAALYYLGLGIVFLAFSVTMLLGVFGIL